jgi:hypothetical protein
MNPSLPGGKTTSTSMLLEAIVWFYLLFENWRKKYETEKKNAGTFCAPDVAAGESYCGAGGECTAS